MVNSLVCHALWCFLGWSLRRLVATIDSGRRLTGPVATWNTVAARSEGGEAAVHWRRPGPNFFLPRTDRSSSLPIEELRSEVGPRRQRTPTMQRAVTRELTEKEMKVVRKIQVMVHMKCLGLPEQDIEDIFSKVMVNILDKDRPIEEWKPLAGTITIRRLADYFRAGGGKGKLGAGPIDADVADRRISPDRAAIIREQKEQLVALLFDRAETAEDRTLVSRVIEECEKEGRMPSLRGIGKELWPERAQTACERWHKLMKGIGKEVGL